MSLLSEPPETLTPGTPLAVAVLLAAVCAGGGWGGWASWASWGGWGGVVGWFGFGLGWFGLLSCGGMVWVWVWVRLVWVVELGWFGLVVGWMRWSVLVLGWREI